MPCSFRRGHQNMKCDKKWTSVIMCKIIRWTSSVMSHQFIYVNINNSMAAGLSRWLLSNSLSRRVAECTGGGCLPHRWLGSLFSRSEPSNQLNSELFSIVSVVCVGLSGPPNELILQRFGSSRCSRDQNLGAMSARRNRLEPRGP